jgi:hypothetical protein
MRAHTAGALAIGIVLFPFLPRGRRGRVVASDTGTPLRRAQVRAASSTSRTTRLTTTNAEGHYEFAGLPADRYAIHVTKAGYVGLEFGPRRPFEGGRPLDLADGQIAEQIDFPPPRGSVIAGLSPTRPGTRSSAHGLEQNVRARHQSERCGTRPVGLAVKGVQPGEEWDPELRKRIEQSGKRFTLKEGETLRIEMPYVED